MYALYDTTTGKLLSVGSTHTTPLPEGVTAVQLDTEDATALLSGGGAWDSTTRAIVARTDGTALALADAGDTLTSLTAAHATAVSIGGRPVYATTDTTVADSWPEFAWIILAPPAAPQTAPGNVALASTSATAVRITYDPVTEADGYEYVVTAGSQVGDPQGTPVDVAGLLDITVTGLTAATTYTVWVRAYNETGPGPWATPSGITTRSAEFADAFDRADASTLGPNWQAMGTMPGVISGQASARASGVRGAALATVALDLPDDHYAQITVNSAAADGHVSVFARTSTTRTGYEATIHATAGWRLRKMAADGGDASVALPAGSSTLASAPRVWTYPHTLRIEAQGTTVRMIVDGITLAEVTDSTHTTGQPGVGFSRDLSRADDFSTGPM